jgi:ATP-dependent RNA helicase DDX1
MDSSKLVWCERNAGRAGMLGMAISLVSTVPERVWYVKAKGYKPWLNPKPQDTKDNDEGGHTIWYNEPDLLQVVKPLLSLQPVTS